MSAEALLSLINSSLDHLARALILALAISVLWLAPPVSPADARRRGRLLLAMVMVTLLCAGIDLILRTAVMADVAADEAWEFIPRVLSHSDYGYYWQWRTAAWIVLFVASLKVIKHGWGVGSVWFVLIATLAIMSLVSVTHHAGEDGFWSITNLINWLHLAGISLWGGAVISYAVLIMPALRGHGGAMQTAVTTRRLSTLATAALVIVLLSGLYNSWQQLDTFRQLWTTGYGRVLSVKLVLVGVMMFIGAMNRFLWVPNVIDWHQAGQRWGAPSQRLLQALRVDSVVFIVIVVTAVILGSQSPPSHAM